MSFPVSPNDVNFYGLLFVSDQHRHANLKRQGKAAIDIYCQTALLTAKSLRHFGINFSILTNDAEQLRLRYEYLGLEAPPLIEEEFDLDVPKDVAFFAAHYKLEIFKKFATKRFGDHVGLIDIDTVMIGPYKPPPRNKLGVIDISREMIYPSNYAKVRSDISRIANFEVAEPRWYGGEYFVGSAERFAELARLFEDYWPRYVEGRTKWVHQGDEMVGSAALNRMRLENDQVIIDDAAAGTVSRWWSSRTGWAQDPLSDIFSYLLLHLPSDKIFLANEAKREFDPVQFKLRYRSYAKRKLILRRFVNLIHNLVSKQKLYVGRLN